MPPAAPRPARAGLAQPVAAVLTDRMDDVAVAEAAARLALARRGPLLLIVVMPRARRKPAGLDAFTLIGAAALRGGSYVHPVAPAARAPCGQSRPDRPSCS
ncbi:hypothetical protein ACFPA8_05125 [Streptomyces ovatisporus]|uniref:UspA domain-containing protein n=1 Tax=Streptomyces ovatisporus TaxID=1128682 RepID=A0ABV9A0Q1_9ACTN